MKMRDGPNSAAARPVSQGSQMTTSYALRAIEEAVDLGVKLSYSWFRGHSCAVAELAPRIFRAEYHQGLRRDLQPHIEASMIDAFQRTAPALISDVPGPGDHEGWLFLMQHHGAPTRLLDWTESVLIALYFAVSADGDKDGELWAMYPVALNAESGIDGFPLPVHPLREYLAGDANLVDPRPLQQRLELKSTPKRPIAFRPALRFPRMLVQRSTFTIHPVPAPGMTIPELLTERKHLVRYVIPADRKQGLLLHLRFLGITHSAIFPDLEGLSRAVVEEHNVVGYSPPDPPHW